MKIFTLCLSNEGEVKIAGDLELAQAKQLIEAILLQQAFQKGVIEGQKPKEVKDAKCKPEAAEIYGCRVGSQESREEDSNWYVRKAT